MFNIMICNITKIRIRLSICTSSEVVLSSICSLMMMMMVVCGKLGCVWACPCIRLIHKFSRVRQPLHCDVNVDKQ